MLRNYIKTALRNLWKNKRFSAINIVGLAIGLATCLLIITFVMDELSYDRYNEKADRIYRLDAEIKFGDNHDIMAQAPPAAASALRGDFPQVEEVVRFRNYGWIMVRKGSENFREDKVIYADSTLFDVFTLPLVAGNTYKALVSPHTAVITERVAKKYFGGPDAVGRTLLVNDSIPYKVTAVIRDLPAQSHFHFNFFLSLAASDEAKNMNDWLSFNLTTYVVLRQGASPRLVEDGLDRMVRKYEGPALESLIHQSFDQFRQSGNFLRFSLMPLTAIHLHSNKDGDLEANGNIQYVYIFSAIAVFILLIACVNFMNLSTARSAGRAREVGVRKVLGSLRRQLVGQFLFESTVLSLLSMILAVGLAWLFLPVFNQLAAKDMTIGLFSRSWLAPVMVALVLVVGLLAGSYPAFFLSAFRPVAVLKGQVSAGLKTGWLRNSLVVFQFAISMVLIVGTVVIYRQLAYIHERDLGFNREQVMIVQNTYTLGNRTRYFKAELSRLPGVTGATMTGFLPTSDYRSDNVYFLTPGLDPKQSISLQHWQVDDHYIPVLGMRMLAGRNFSPLFPTDSNGVIVNEAAAKMMGAGQLLEKKLYRMDDSKGNKVSLYHVIGVIKDFNFSSLRQVVTPLALFLEEDRSRIALRVDTKDLGRLVSQVEDEWRRFAPGQPFSYTFMDEEFNELYRTEQRMGGISFSFSLLAMFVACLGLFGLVTYAAEQRTREIGIRKVLGATMGGIVSLLSQDFLRLVLIAMVVAFPVAWWVMTYWLRDFAYRISIGWEVFAVTGVLSTGIAMGTVGLQAVKAALANPVEALRSE
jgi:putative ABC transport system permease protein